MPLFTRRRARGTSSKNVALAVIVNPQNAAIFNTAGGGAGEGVSEDMVRDWIERDLTRYPEHRSKAAAIEDVVIVTDESVSSDNYAQDVADAYTRYMRAGGWAQPDGLHIVEMDLALATVYIAYGI